MLIKVGLNAIDPNPLRFPQAAHPLYKKESKPFSGIDSFICK